MANLKEVAELAGVSIATASLALRGGGNIRESTRIRGKGEFGAESHSTLSGGERIAWPKRKARRLEIFELPRRDAVSYAP